MYGAAPQVSLTSPPASVSAIWKNTEPLHTCNICDVKFCNLGLLNLHKLQDHGVKHPVNNISSSRAPTPVSGSPRGSTSGITPVSTSTVTSLSNGETECRSAQSAGKPSSKVHVILNILKAFNILYGLKILFDLQVKQK